MNNAANLTHIITEAGLVNAAQRVAFNTFGCTDCSGLMNHTKEDLKSIWNSISENNRGLAQEDRINISELCKKRIDALRRELIMRDECISQYEAVILATLTAADLDHLVMKHTEWEEVIKANASMTLPDVDIPKLTKDNWKRWSTTIKELFSQTYGKNYLPLLYIIRDEEVGDYDEVYNSTEEQLLSCISLNGTKARGDRQTVYSLLTQYAKDSHVMTTIDRYKRGRDSRLAWNSIKQQIETSSYDDSMRTAAMSAMNNAVYKGELKYFGIDKYYAIHSDAHNKLFESGAPLGESMKITHFKSGLQDTTALMYSNFVSSNPLNTNSFDVWYAEFSTMMKAHIGSTKKPEGRHINQVTGYGGRDGRGGRTGRGGRNGGRGYGRGRGRGRGTGRGRGRGGFGRGGYNNNLYNNGYTPYNNNHNTNRFIPEDCDYNNNEWHGLNGYQRFQIHELRCQNAKATNQNRNVNSAQSEDARSIPSTIQTPGNGNPQPSNTTNPGRAGDAFCHSGSNRSTSNVTQDIP